MLSCWEVNLAVYRWLDERLPFWQHPTRRLMSQILLGGVATLLTFAFVFPLAQRVYTQHWPEPYTVLKGVVVCVTLASLVNGGYSGLYLLRAFSERQKRTDSLFTQQTSQSEIDIPARTTPALLDIDVPNGRLRLPMDQLAYFYSTGGLILLVKTDGQQITTRYSAFSQLTPNLDPHYFFQLSRQFIVGLGAVRAVQSDSNRKLVVTLIPALHRQAPHEEVVVSRYRSADFRNWLEASANS
ncbi:hypothetical protein GCM10028773_33510 [Spirosoma koreense]